MAATTWCSPRRVVARCLIEVRPCPLKPAIEAANQALAQLDPDGRPDLPPEGLRLYDLLHTAASLMTTSWTPSPAAWRTPRRGPGDPGLDPARTSGRALRESAGQ